MRGLMFSWILPSKIWIYALLGVFIVGFIWRIYKAGGDRVKLNQLQKEFDIVVKRNKIKDDVSRMSDSTVLNQLRKHGWIKESD